MNGNNILVDTNLIILGIGGNQLVRELLEGHTLFISVITEIELLSIPFTVTQDEKLMRNFISNCFIIDLDGEVKQHTITIRKKNKIKLPDAIIAASSIAKKLPLFTADKGFSKVPELNIVLF
ncbi:MAG: type II toxin-antitoxin system VapC family toxin [Bacteroidetes bacterium]|nr:type II toxin-antitoxin system VapC family toxin [Bacteroidota bacterium]MBI3483073.1 type II toxin-antitoxin system VapC family toxin [Bacteroidota bacterium]